MPDLALSLGRCGRDRGFLSCSLPPFHPAASLQRGTDRCTSWPNLTSLCPVPGPAKSQMEPFLPRDTRVPPARALSLSLPSLGTWARGFSSTPPSSSDCLPGGAEAGGRGAGQPLGLAGPQDCCCSFPDCKETLWKSLASTLPQLSWTFYAFPLLAPEKVRHFTHVSWQDMAWTSEKALKETSCAVRAGTS